MLSATKQVGTIGELAVSQRLLRTGWDVYSSIGDCTKIDLIAIQGKHIVRLQVKTVEKSTTGVVCVAGSKVISRKSVWYDRDDFDNLAVYVVDRDAIAFVPMSLLFQSSMNLRFESPKNGQVKLIHWFRDYETLRI